MNANAPAVVVGEVATRSNRASTASSWRHDNFNVDEPTEQLALRSLFRTVLGLSLFLGVVSPAVAESRNLEQMGTPEQRAACRADVRRLCRSVPPEEGTMALYACLKANRHTLSVKCGQVIAGDRR